MHQVSLIKLGAQTLTYTVLDKSRILNGLAKRITFGSVTRNKLAKSIITNTVAVAQNYAIANKALGKRSAEIINQTRSVLFDNTRQQVDNGVPSLVSLLLQSKGQGKFAQKLAAGIAQYLGPSLLNDHALERVLVALKEQKGGENVLKMTLNNALSGIIGGKIISATFMSALKRAILDLPEYKPTSPLHHMAAWKLHQSLAVDHGSLPPMPKGLQVIEAIAGNVPGMVASVCRQMDHIQNFLQLPHSEKELVNVFTECWPSDLTVNENITPKDFARLVLMAHTSDQTCILEKNIDELPAKEQESLQHQFKEISTFLARMPEPTIKVAQNWTGGIESVSAQHSKEHAASPKLENFMHNQFRAPVHHPEEIASYFADGAFIEAFKKGIDLKVNSSQQGYGRWIAGMGSQIISQAKDMWGGQQQLTHAQQRQLGQLSELVDNNAMSMMALTRYLIPEVITQAVQDEVFNQFTRKQPNLLLADNLWMTVGQPDVSFVVSKKTGVDIDITLKWPVTGFGANPEELTALQSRQSHISATVNVNMLFNDKGVAKQAINISATQISLNDTLNFGPSKNGEIPTPLTVLNRGVLKKAAEMVSTC